MDIIGKSHVGFSRLGGGSKKFKTFNPQTNSDNPWEFIEASKEETSRAVEMAWQAFKVYRNIAGVKRADFLNAIADEIEKIDRKFHCS